MSDTSLAPPRLSPLLPGLALTGALAGLAFGLRLIPGMGVLSPLILAILLGVALRNVLGLPDWAAPGMRFALQRLLRWGVVALGLQLTLGQVVEVGAGGLLTLVLALGATFGFTLWLGRLLGVAPGLTRLIATGTSVCGATAVIAANAVVGAEDEDAAYAIATVTIFGTLAMLAFPLIGAGMEPRAFGLWTGAAIHEVAQVVAAGTQAGPQALAFATIAKLTRVALLAPVVLILARSLRRPGQARGARPPFPGFVLGFLAMVALASTGWLPPSVTGDLARPLAQGLLALGMAAMGLQTDLARLATRGLAPLALGGLASVFLAAVALALVFLTAGF